MNITKLTKPARKALKLKKCGAVIVAAGNASRMKGIDKILTPLAGSRCWAGPWRRFRNATRWRRLSLLPGLT